MKQHCCHGGRSSAQAESRQMQEQEGGKRRKPILLRSSLPGLCCGDSLRTAPTPSEQGGYYGARKRPHFTPSMSPQRRSKEEAEIAEELRLLEEATVNLAATSQMKARYAYTDSVDAESELHLILESVRDFYRYVTLSRPLIWHIPHCILIAYWHLADPPPLSLSLFAAVM